MPTRHKYFKVTTIPNSVTWDTWQKLSYRYSQDPIYVRNNQRCYLINTSYVCKDAMLEIGPRTFKCYGVEIGKRKFWVDPKYKILIPKNWAYIQEDEKTYLKRLEKL